VPYINYETIESISDSSDVVSKILESIYMERIVVISNDAVHYGTEN
jgi:hypothetical protein